MSDALLASKIVISEEEPSVISIGDAPTSVTGAVGVTQRGPHEETLVTSFDEYVRVYGGYDANSDLVLAAQGFFDEGGSQLWVKRLVHYSDITDASTKTSSAATRTITTASLVATKGTVTGTNIAPFAMATGQTIIGNVDGVGNQTATFTGTKALKESGAGTYALSDGLTLLVAVDGAANQTIVFSTGNFVSIGAATVAEVVNAINGQILGASASATSGGTKVTITSDRGGTGSSIKINGGTANAGILAFATTINNGTGNVSNIGAVTVAEVKTILEAALTNGSGVTVTDVSSAVKIESNTTSSSSSILIVSSSTADTILGLDNSTHLGNDSGTLSTLKVDGKTDGTYANGLKAEIEAASSGNADEFNLLVTKNGVTVENFPNVTMDDDAPNYVETVVNDENTGSNLIVVTDLDAATVSPDDRPATGSYQLSGGTDGLSSLGDADYIGNEASGTGLHGFDNVDDLSLLIVPGRATTGVHLAMISYCEVTRDKQVFAVLDCPANNSAAQIVTYVTATAGLKELSEFGAMYWPRITVSNPSSTVYGTAADVTVAPSGHICGVYARNDSAKPGGVYEAPANIDFGKITRATGVEMREVNNQNKRDLVFPQLINPIVKLKGTPVHIDGARTLKSTGNFPTIGERRGVIFIEKSVKTGLLPYKHRKIKPKLLAAERRAVHTFLLTQCNNDAFASDDPNLAFRVDFSAALNNSATARARMTKGRIGLATAKPNEFIWIAVAQDTSAIDAAAA